jgi:glycosyltransferase involved in cell wall biosynthesis
MPRVLRIINRFNLGGITYNVSYLSRYMASDYETLLVGGPEEEGEASSLYIPHSLGLEPVIIHEMRRSVNPFSDYLAYRRIKKIIRNFKPDIVHTHASKAGAVGRLAARHCRVPCIVHTFHGHVFHGYFGSVRTWVYKTIERKLAGFTNAIVAISEKQKTELTEIYHICEPGKVSVIPLGFDLSRFTIDMESKRRSFRSTWGIEDSEIAIGIIGRLVPVKDHKLFIEAVTYLNEKTTVRFKALIIGDGESRDSLIDYAVQKNIPFAHKKTDKNARLIFTGWIKEADLALAGLDLVCLTSRNEGTPVSLIEAQAAGKFVVSTDVGGIGDILHTASGYLSPAGDRKKFMANLLKAVEESGRNQPSVSEEVRRKFSYQRLCADMEILYQKLLKEN